MKRFAGVACVVVALLLIAAANGSAQPSVVGADQSRFYAGVTLGPTFGHKSSGFVGIEAGANVSEPVAVFVEGGHMNNVGTSDLDTRAQTIANAVGATASASYKVNYFAVGVRVAPDLALRVRPYVSLGVGLAQVKAETALAVNGTTVAPESLGVQFGSDLSGTEKKGYFTIGGGVLYPFGQRFYVDLSYRYGRVGAKTSQIENDKGINTQRLQIGVGARF